MELINVAYRYRIVSNNTIDIEDGGTVVATSQGWKQGWKKPRFFKEKVVRFLGFLGFF